MIFFMLTQARRNFLHDLELFFDAPAPEYLPPIYKTGYFALEPDEEDAKK